MLGSGMNYICLPMQHSNQINAVLFREKRFFQTITPLVMEEDKFVMDCAPRSS